MVWDRMPWCPPIWAAGSHTAPPHSYMPADSSSGGCSHLLDHSYFYFSHYAYPPPLFLLFVSFSFLCWGSNLGPFVLTADLISILIIVFCLLGFFFFLLFSLVCSSPTLNVLCSCCFCLLSAGITDVCHRIQRGRFFLSSLGWPDPCDLPPVSASLLRSQTHATIPALQVGFIVIFFSCCVRRETFWLDLSHCLKSSFVQSWGMAQSSAPFWRTTLNLSSSPPMDRA